MTGAPARCEHCGQALGDYFEVTRVSADRGPFTVRVCSMLCLIRWAYTYSFVQGQRGVAAIQSAFDKIASALGGPPPQPPATPRTPGRKK